MTVVHPMGGGPQVGPLSRVRADSPTVDDSEAAPYLDRIATARQALEAASLEQDRAIVEGREAGVSWGQLGKQLGISRAGAQSLYRNARAREDRRLGTVAHCDSA